MNTHRNQSLFTRIISFIREKYSCPAGVVPLHAPRFTGKEKQYLLDCIDSTFVSSVGPYVDLFERKIEEYTGARCAVAVVNGTAALHTALLLAGVQRDDEVFTQAVGFVATANAIAYCGALPVFLDSDRQTMGLSPEALERFLSKEAERREDGLTYNRKTGRRISACVPMHVFGHPVRIDRIKAVCERYNIVLVEDAAESLGSFYKAKHTGTFGRLGVLSFNGNKTITTGGGGMIITDDEELGKAARHLTTTAKVPHRWEYVHDAVGYNYRMPNINAALGCAQMEQLVDFIDRKRALAADYNNFFKSVGVSFVSEPEACASNYWLNAIILADSRERDEFLEYSNSQNVMTRPLWRLLPKLSMYGHCRTDTLENAQWLEERLVNIPSSVP